MITVNDLKNGLTFKYNGNIYMVLEFQHVKPGKGSAFVRTKLKNLTTGSTQDITFSNTSEKIEKAHIEKKEMQFLYSEGETYYMMDMETYDQLEVEKKAIADVLNFLTENMMVTLVMHEGSIMDVQIPEKLTFEVIEAEPSIKGNTVSGGDKMAKISTGFDIRVPLFVEVGDNIVVNTVRGEYVSREK